MVVIGNDRMKKIKVLHQVLDPSGAGGVSAEFRALKRSKLSEKYDFQSMILKDFHPGINWHDIHFYYKRIKEVCPDIVHVRGAAVDGLNAVIAAKLAGKCKVLTTVHGMYSDLVFISRLKRWISKNIIERAIFSLSDGISCVCKNATERQYFDPYRKKMLPFVYNRIPKFDVEQRTRCRMEICRRFGLSDSDIICAFVGRMTREKGLLTLERMFKDVQIPTNLTFLFVGDGDYRKQFEANCNNFQTRTLFVGMQENVQKYYLASDFFIQPSLHENHSIALLEACAAGIPSVATDCGGNNEIVIDGFTGLLVPVDDAIALGIAINKICDQSILSKYQENVRCMNYSKFSNRECDNALDDVYQTILRR